jgi:hypothetical protein
MLHTVSSINHLSLFPPTLLHSPLSPRSAAPVMHDLHIRLHVHVHAWRSSRDPDPTPSTSVTRSHERDVVQRTNERTTTVDNR